MTRLISLAGLLLGFLSALVVSSAACTDCLDYGFAESYTFVEEPSGWVPGSGRLVLGDDVISITYTTLDGSEWEVEYTYSSL